MAKEKTKGDIHGTEILTNQLATIVGKTPQWIRQLTRDGVLKQSARGKYILSDAIQAYIEHVQGGKEDSNKPRYVDAKTEHEFIKKEKAELELRAIKGQLHESKDVRRVMSDMILTVKSKLLSIPARIGPQLDCEPAKKIESTLHNEISDALRSFTDYSPELFAKQESEE
ncbi:hypothetical protein [Bacillus sp. ISL-57]|uniref:hypothetical protein n=1 Tax=Bacillus sp. ISL-57 TaxID=2819135 RepID=UPI001BE8869A|nr:hypothetical protein [Bacillus sp. ISL-57]MBT2717538.1 hypothetical protein [Bacillus sp. ISL-57]